jgi:DNA-binding transcriptional ArsR family regulator
MSRGLGKVERAILELLLSYERIGTDLGWTWRVGGSFERTLAFDSDIRMYELGHRIEVCRLRREIGMSAAVLSRALRSLYRKGLVHLFAATLEHRSDSISSSNPAVKFAGLSGYGYKRKQNQSYELSAYLAAARDEAEASQ